MGTGDYNAGGSPWDGLASHPGGRSNIPSRFMLRKPELSAGLMGHLARMQTLHAFTFHILLFHFGSVWKMFYSLARGRVSSAYLTPRIKLKNALLLDTIWRSNIL